MTRTRAYASTFETLINRAPEGGQSGATVERSRPENWSDCEEQLRIIERCASTLSVLADACGNGAYTSNQKVEESLMLVTDNINAATIQLFKLLGIEGGSANV